MTTVPRSELSGPVLSCEVQETVGASVERVGGAFLDGTVFALTGASTVQADARLGGSFELTFSGRGVVSGVFVTLFEDGRLSLAWNVSGFDRADEATRVEIFVDKAASGSVVRIVHSRVGSPESAAAKTRAWESILRGLDARLSPRA